MAFGNTTTSFKHNYVFIVKVYGSKYEYLLILSYRTFIHHVVTCVRNLMHLFA